MPVGKKQLSTPVDQDPLGLAGQGPGGILRSPQDRPYGVDIVVFDTMKAQPTQGGETLRCSGAGSDARGTVARRDRRFIRQAQSARQRRPSTNRARPPSAGEMSRGIAASVLRGAPTARRPLSPIPRDARCFTPSSGSAASRVFCFSVPSTPVASAVLRPRSNTRRAHPVVRLE